MDIVAENVAKLKELFPEAFTEDGTTDHTEYTEKKKIDFEVLKELLGEYVSDKEERYSFNWNGKSKARMIAQTPSTGTLRPCKEESVDWASTQNIFIEGDNLEVLKLLQKSYHKKVKMIYIDPPYNTGKDFVYKDNFKDNIKNYKAITGQVDGEGRNLSNNPETSGRYHTDWLNMMYPRLKLAINLLKDDGVIFISIDDNEVSNLRKMCDEIFGEENFVDQIIWKKRYGGGAKEKFLVTLHEYILVYAKDISSLPEMFIPLEEDSIKKYYKQKDDNFSVRGPYRTHPLEATKSMGERSNLVYPILSPDGQEIMPKRQWLWSKERAYDALLKGELEFVKSKDVSLSVHTKQYLRDENGNIRKGKAFSIVDNVYSQHGTNEIIELFGEAQTFSFPKPTKLMNFLQSIGCPEDGLVLDLFAGSASTAHALLSQNAQDRFKRNFLCVQIPEPTEEKSVAYKTGYSNIADISKERIRRAAAKIKERLEPKNTRNTQKKDEDLLNFGEADPSGSSACSVVKKDSDLGFKVFKLDSTNIRPWEVDFDLDEKQMEAFVENIKTDRGEEDVLYEILIKYGLDLTLPVTEHAIAGYKVFDIGMGALIICLSDAISLEVVEGIAKLKDELNPEIMRVVFKDSGFKDDVVKTNAVQILQQAGINDVRSL